MINGRPDPIPGAPPGTTYPDETPKAPEPPAPPPPPPLPDPVPDELVLEETKPAPKEKRK